MIHNNKIDFDLVQFANRDKHAERTCVICSKYIELLGDEVHAFALLRNVSALRAGCIREDEAFGLTFHNQNTVLTCSAPVHLAGVRAILFAKSPRHRITNTFTQSTFANITSSITNSSTEIIATESLKQPGKGVDRG